VGLLRTIDRIDAHRQLANLNELKHIDGRRGGRRPVSRKPFTQANVVQLNTALQHGRKYAIGSRRP
jgi:hypothetical protein